MSRNYKVGKGKPPKNSQFKKGRSGNPKGRPKNSKNVHTVLNDIWNGKVTVRENGKTRRVSFSEAFVRKLADKAINGSVNDQFKFLKALEEYAPKLVEAAVKDLAVTVSYVLPEGVSADQYRNSDGSGTDRHPISPSEPRNNPVDGEIDDDSWLN